MRYTFRFIQHILKLSAVRKVLETILILALGSFGTLGPKLSHGTSWIAEIIHWIISPNVRTHLREVSKMTSSLIKNTGDLLGVFDWNSVSGDLFFTYFPKLRSYRMLSHDNLPITSRSQKKDEDIGDEKDSADRKSCLKHQASIIRS